MFTSDEIAAVTRPLAEASTLPPSAYTNPGVFEEEVGALFQREWVCVAREEQLPEPGQYRNVEVGRQPLIVVRQADGSIKAMSAICPHRGMPVVSDHGRASNFSCPYHRWKFGLDGHLISAPLMDNVDGFPESDCGLSPIKVECWQGFVFVNLDPNSPPLAERLTALNQLMDGYDMQDMVIAGSIDFDCPWNWKILVENFMEAYHHIGPHNESLQSTYPATRSSVSGSVEEGWSVLHMPSVEHEDTGLPPLPNLTERQAGEITASVIMPTFCWINSPAVAFWYQLNPKGHNDMDLTIHALIPRSLAESEFGKDIGDAVLESVKHIHLEDIPVNEGPWRGQQAPLTKQGRLSLLEESIWQLNNWWVRRVAGEQAGA